MKKVISPEHVVEALTTLGFQEYVTDVKAVHKEYKEQASVSVCVCSCRNTDIRARMPACVTLSSVKMLNRYS